MNTEIMSDRLAHTIEWAASPNDVRHDEEKPTIVLHAFLAQSMSLVAGSEHRHAEQVCIATNLMSIDFWKTKQTSGVRCPLCIAILTEGLRAEVATASGEVCPCGEEMIPGSTRCLKCGGHPPEGRKYWRYANGALSKTETFLIAHGSKS